MGNSTRTVASTGGTLLDVSTRTTALSQFCHGCGKRVKKPLSQRWHQCACGIGPVQRDLYSAFLAAYLDPADPIPSCARYTPYWEGAEARLRAAHERLIQRAKEGQTLPGSFGVVRARVRLPERPHEPTQEPADLLRRGQLEAWTECAEPPVFSTGEFQRVSVKQEVNGAASTYVHTRVRVGDVLEVSAPRGTFTLQQDLRPVVLLSAGVGATPVLAILHVLAAEASPREVWWLFGARNRDEHPFAQEAARLLQRLPNSYSYILYSRPGQEEKPGLDFDAAGHLSVAMLKEIGVPREADFYLCGPPAFLQDLTSGLADWGVTRERVHTEVFSPAASSTPGLIEAPRRPPHPPVGSSETGPLVSFARSGLTVHWDPEFQSLLELAEAYDVPVRWSCRTGVCHSCESGLIAGRISYQPEPLERPANGTLLICCSQPCDEVMLDL